MYAIPEVTKDFYQKHPNALEARKLLWLEIFEKKIRNNRPSEKTIQDFAGDVDTFEAAFKFEQYLREIEAQPLNEVELKAWNEFVEMIKKGVSFWTFPDEEDFTKLLKKYALFQRNNAGQTRTHAQSNR